LVFEVGDGEGTFGAFEGATQRVFARTVGAGVALSHAGESASAVRHLVAERVAGERVTYSDVAIEIWEGRDEQWVGDLAFDDDGQPESELAQPDGGGIDVDAEDRSGEQFASQFPNLSGVAESAAEGGEFFEDVDEEGAASACGVEDGE
jgi:hypothetical protein